MKRKVDICFVVLHYMDLELTRRTILSIRELQNIQNSKIIIVDNNSPNKSGITLKEQYQKDDIIDVLLLKTNDGFSIGNNAGYQWCRDRYDMDFVVAVNNDVTFEEKDFIKKLYYCYEQEAFYVAGPDIYIPHRYYHQSPISPKLRTAKDMLEAIEDGYKREKEYKKVFSIKICRKYLADVLRDNKLMIKCMGIYRKAKPQRNINWKDVQEGAVLQGACIIFSRKYCQMNSVLFEPLTFMYGEEDFLTLKCMKNHWKIIYLPQLKVSHVNKGSTINNKISYREFCKKTGNSIAKYREAQEIYINEYKKYG